MLQKSEIRTRVERIIAGTRNSRDLDRLFSWLRFRSFGNAAVRDIGDFTAHLEDRNQGLSWTGVQHLSAMLSYHIPRVELANTTKVPIGNAATFAKAAMASFETVSPSLIESKFGLGKAGARRVLEAGLGKVRNFIGSELNIEGNLKPLEWRLIEYFGTVMHGEPSLTDDLLISQLAQVLIRNKLITDGEADSVLKQRDFVALFAIEKMHGCKIRIENGATASLQAGVIGDRSLGVTATFKVPWADADVQLAYEVFSTHCDPAEWLDPSVPFGMGWDEPLEINGNGKLEFIS